MAVLSKPITRTKYQKYKHISMGEETKAWKTICPFKRSELKAVILRLGGVTVQLLLELN